MRLDRAFPDLVHAYVYFFGICEPAITAIYRAAVRSGDTVIDIGANVAEHTLLAAALVGPRGRVDAIEASPDISARQQRNLAANGTTQVAAYDMAVTDRAGPVPVSSSRSACQPPTATTALRPARTGPDGRGPDGRGPDGRGDGGQQPTSPYRASTRANRSSCPCVVAAQPKPSA